MSDYVLLTPQGGCFDLSDVDVDQRSRVAAFTAPFGEAPAGECVLVRRSDRAAARVWITGFSDEAAGPRWYAIA